MMEEAGLAQVGVPMARKNEPPTVENIDKALGMAVEQVEKQLKNLVELRAYINSNQLPELIRQRLWHEFQYYTYGEYGG